MASELHGRDEELDRIDALLAGARASRSGVLVLVGEAGIGKTALLRHARTEADGFTVLQAEGVESEAELPFAALSDLLRPSLDVLPRIPPRQRSALEAALALGPPVEVDPFAVCAATLSTLAAAAEEGPLLITVDSAQWLDASSAQALLFAARRLADEGIALLAAARDEGEGLVHGTGLPELAVGGLDSRAAAALLAAAERPIAADVARRLAAATAGNPLALLEAPRLLTDAQLDGRQPIPDPLPPGPTVRDAFLRRLGALPTDTQRALLVVAASESGDLGLVLAALERLRIDADALRPAEEAGLLVGDGRLELSHPLLRSTVYHGAAATSRREVHQVLAEAAGAVPERRAWHLAAAAWEPDANAADALVEAAESARRRGGHAEASSAFARAARLTSDTTRAAELLVDAADSARLAGRSGEALQFVGEAATLTDDPMLRARIQHMRGSVEMWRGAPLAARGLLVDEAGRILELDRAKASRMLTDAGFASFMAGEIKEGLTIAERAAALAAQAGGISELVANGLLGIGLLLAGDSARALPLLAQFQPLVEELSLTRPRQLVQPGGQVLIWLEEYGQARQLLSRMLESARAQSALGVLPYTLASLSELNFRTGNWAAAYAEASEAVQIARDLEQTSTVSFSLVCAARVEAAQGREEECRAHIAEAQELTAFGVGSVVGYAESTFGLLELGLGRAHEAIAPLAQLADQARRHGLREPGVIQWAPDLVEAYVRAGRPDEAARELEEFEAQAESSGRVWALADAARCRGLLADEETFEQEFIAALEHHQASPMPFERARTELCLGERLRRGRRRADAREPLRRAIETFERLGAAPWAERARTELRASGETARRSDPSAAEQLTPQELQVALVVARGATNKEAAAALFLSEKTIEAHLGRIYRKLGIRSRTELATRLASEGALADAA